MDGSLVSMAGGDVEMNSKSSSHPGKRFGERQTAQLQYNITGAIKYYHVCPD